MQRIIVTILLIAGMINFSNCENIFNNKEESSDSATIPEWYPSIISDYTQHQKIPYSELNPGQTEFTEDEIIRYAGQFIDEHKEIIGADSKSLRLVRIVKSQNNPQKRKLFYQQIYSYNFKIVTSRYGNFEFRSSGGKVTSWSSSVIPVVPIPNKQIVSAHSIRKKIIGQTITYYLSGYPLEVEVSENDEFIFRNLVVYPLLKEDTLEVRLCCEMEVVVNGFSWSFFYDVITGEKIAVGQNFR